MIVTVKANHKDSTSNFSTTSWSDALRVQRRLTVLQKQIDTKIFGKGLPDFYG